MPEGPLPRRHGLFCFNMRLFITIDQAHAVEWELSFQETIMFSWLNDLPRWANQQISEGKVFYMASYSKAISDLPIITDKQDTVYRIYKKLQEKKLIKIVFVDKCPYVLITAKGQKWNTKYNSLGKQQDSETSSESNEEEENSDSHPNNGQPSEENNDQLGQSSETPRTAIRHIDSNNIDSKLFNIINSPSDLRERERESKFWPKPIFGDFIPKETIEVIENELENCKNQQEYTEIILKNQHLIIFESCESRSGLKPHQDFSTDYLKSLSKPSETYLGAFVTHEKNKKVVVELFIELMPYNQIFSMHLPEIKKHLATVKGFCPDYEIFLEQVLFDKYGK